MGLDPVSVYLATTSGGLDSVAAVAAELQGDTAVIVTVHLVRLLCVLIVGPWLVRARSKCGKTRKFGGCIMIVPDPGANRS